MIKLPTLAAIPATIHSAKLLRPACCNVWSMALREVAPAFCSHFVSKVWCLWFCWMNLQRAKIVNLPNNNSSIHSSSQRHGSHCCNSYLMCNANFYQFLTSPWLKLRFSRPPLPDIQARWVFDSSPGNSSDTRWGLCLCAARGKWRFKMTLADEEVTKIKYTLW